LRRVRDARGGRGRPSPYNVTSIVVTKTITTSSESETAVVGRELAATLAAGDVVLLYGELGAGKTAFVKGMAEGLGVARDEVSSPTFTLVQEYRGGRLPLFHVDLYRLDDRREVDDLGLEEIADAGVLAIEWADKQKIYDTAIHVRIVHGDEDARVIHISDSATHQLATSRTDNYSDR
jgi:tRNA threonylcarbamoyladenosine biosynthesis protein TsaE